MMDFDCFDDEGEDISGDLDELKVVIYKPDMETDNSFKTQVYEYIEKSNQKLVEEDDSDDDTEVWVKRKGRRISECHVIFQGEQNGVLLSFLGDFKIDDLDKIPFLPIQFFKKHSIKTGEWSPEVIFTSSGTTGQTPSQHFVKDINWYNSITQKGFEEHYGKVEDFCASKLPFLCPEQDN